MRASITPLIAAALLAAPSSLLAQSTHNDPYVAGPANESRLAQQVRHELIMLPYYSIFDDLAFRINGSTVTLLGSVSRPTLKSDAENVVKRIEGVTQVINQSRFYRFRLRIIVSA